MPVCVSRSEVVNNGVKGQVLDLDTAVKDGYLGGGIGFGGGFAEKMDLNKMIEELIDLQDVPSVFICPISLEPMQDPVTLCTGQTYERGNILKWFSLGHFTCPTTMQELWDDSGYTHKTSISCAYMGFHKSMCKWKEVGQKICKVEFLEVLDGLKKVKGQARVKSLKELRRFVANHVSARKTVVDKGGVSVLSGLLGPYTSHAIGSEVVSILVNLSLDSCSRLNLMQPAKVSLVVDRLNEGLIETKINCTKLIQMLMEEDDFQVEIVSSHSLLVALMRMVRDKRHPSGILPGLMLLKSISQYTNESLIVYIGVLVKGKLALSNCSNTIPNTVKVLMRVSESCTQLALSILWSICKLSPEEYSSIAVDVGLAAKLLLVIQSGCDPLLKQRSAELLKLCSLNYTDSIFISKCKLTRTIR
ncbi:U-box domain-containing protein 30-like protein [Tanacetum coccineum]